MGDAEVDAYGSDMATWRWISHLSLCANADVPVDANAAYGRVDGVPLHLSAVAIAHPAKLWKPNSTILSVEKKVLPSRPPDCIVVTFFLVGRWLDPSALLFGQLVVERDRLGSHRPQQAHIMVGVNVKRKGQM